MLELATTAIITASSACLFLYWSAQAYRVIEQLRKEEDPPKAVAASMKAG
jgi:hypothetical protein